MSRKVKENTSRELGWEKLTSVKIVGARNLY